MILGAQPLTGLLQCPFRQQKHEGDFKKSQVVCLCIHFLPMCKHKLPFRTSSRNVYHKPQLGVQTEPQSFWGPGPKIRTHCGGGGWGGGLAVLQAGRQPH